MNNSNALFSVLFYCFWCWIELSEAKLSANHPHKAASENLPSSCSLSSYYTYTLRKTIHRVYFDLLIGTVSTNEVEEHVYEI